MGARLQVLNAKCWLLLDSSAACGEGNVARQWKRGRGGAGAALGSQAPSAQVNDVVEIANLARDFCAIWPELGPTCKVQSVWQTEQQQQQQSNWGAAKRVLSRGLLSTSLTRPRSFQEQLARAHVR
jgi:hypothetical protein